MRKLLREFYNDELLCSELRFKGGTAAMMFEGLPRFSTDLDFNMVNKANQGKIYERIVDLMSGYGQIVDKADKFFGPVVVLDYGHGERNLKIEVSNRKYDNHYDNRNFGSMIIPVMTKADMFSHKLCALLNRRAPRDVFDIWYFLSKGWPLNGMIIRERTGMDVGRFLENCSVSVRQVHTESMMREIGELLDDTMKSFVRSGKLVAEAGDLLEDYALSPVLVEQEPVRHSQLLVSNAGMIDAFLKNGVDPSQVSDRQLSEILSGKRIVLRKKTGEGVPVQIVSGKCVVGRGRHPGQ